MFQVCCRPGTNHFLHRAKLNYMYIIELRCCVWQGVDCVIALTHMRWPNDIRLAKNVSEIDLILGGHDHEFTVKNVCVTFTFVIIVTQEELCRL